MNQTTLDEAKKLAASGDYRRIPLTREIMADIRTPIQVLRALQNVSDHCFLLESAEDSRQWGRYTFLGYDPQMELICKNHELEVKAGGSFQIRTDHPGEWIRKMIEDYRSPAVPGLPTLTGGLVGFFSYTYMKYGEPTLDERLKADDIPDLDLMLFDRIIAFDHYKGRIILIVNIKTDALDVDYNRGVLALNQMEELIRRGKEKENPGGHLKEPLRPYFTEEEYCSRVEAIKNHIREGDIFQLVFSNPLQATYEGSLLNTYRILRTTNPSPYMFYFSGDMEIAGASPETLVRVEDRVIRTFPLAGTRPRGRNSAEDRRLEEELLADEKERAEHNMLVDLGRNDLGRLCRFGSVHVDKYLEVERFSHVMHLASEIAGTLREDVNAEDCIDSVLPAGTLSGAPKIRACELISDYEGQSRGLYGGAVGYVDFTGNLDVCIAIRLAYKKNGRVLVQSGAGIVADSVPEKEYQECLNKAKAVTEAIRLAEEAEHDTSH